MIRFNDNVVCQDEAPSTETDPDAALHRRDFQKILKACKGLVEVFDPEPAEHVARGILSNLRDNCPTVLLSYDPEDRSLRLTVKLPHARPLSQAQFLLVMRLQALTRLARFCLDDRRDGLMLEAVSICSEPGKARQVLVPMSESLREVLQDDRLKAIIGS